MIETFKTWLGEVGWMAIQSELDRFALGMLLTMLLLMVFWATHLHADNLVKWLEDSAFMVLGALLTQINRATNNGNTK